MDFEWDVEKERANRERHGVSFDEAKELFTTGVDYLEIYDIEHSEDEDRFIAIGPVRRGLIVVVYTERFEETTRIISARFATGSEAGLFRRYMGEAR
jgi:uncharacterized DUF497 family protein